MAKLDPKQNQYRDGDTNSIKRAFDGVYDDINELIESINSVLLKAGSENELTATNTKVISTTDEREGVYKLPTTDAKHGDIKTYKSKVQYYVPGDKADSPSKEAEVVKLAVYIDDLGWCSIDNLNSYGFETGAITASNKIAESIPVLRPIKNRKIKQKLGS